MENECLTEKQLAASTTAEISTDKLFDCQIKNEGEDKGELQSEMKPPNATNETPNPRVEREASNAGGNKGELQSEIKSLNTADEKPNLHHAEGGVSNAGGNGAEVQSEIKSLNAADETPNLRHSEGEVSNARENEGELQSKTKPLNTSDETPNLHHAEGQVSKNQVLESNGMESENQEEKNQTMEEVPGEGKDVEPVFDGTEAPGAEATCTLSGQSFDLDSGAQGFAWPEKAVAIKNFVREKSFVAVSTVFRRLSGKGEGDVESPTADQEYTDKTARGSEDEVTSPGSKAKEVSQTGEWSSWNPLNYIKIARNAEIQNKAGQGSGIAVEDSIQEAEMKGRVILYTRLGCQDSREVRKFLHQKRLKYIEINIDIYPTRKAELEKNTGSSAVPRVFFNDRFIGGLNELKAMDESGELDQKISDLINEEPSPAAPLPPLSGEDDVSGTGTVDELAIIVRKMRESILVKDRFYKMRRFTNCFLASEAVDFLSEDQYLEREEAVEFGRKLANKYFFRHVLDENVFEDGNHVCRFLDHDPIVMSQCYNIPRGIIDVKPKPIVEISSRLRFLMFAMFEAYVSDDGRHVDYQSIRTTEEFARYLRIIEELQRVDIQDLSREEKLAFFINLYNMMAIHAILTWGYPIGALERRKLFGDFKYIVGGCTYSLSAIQNGILRANQRPPYNLTKPFGARDLRSKVALSCTEPLSHFALVCGTRSGPALRCYSPGNIDNELMEAARNFLQNGGVVVDTEAKVASVSKILRWYSVDFGKNEAEVMKYAANYLQPEKSAELLELLSSSQLKVTYQPYDWGSNC